MRNNWKRLILMKTPTKNFTSLNLPFGKRLKTINLFDTITQETKDNQEIMTL